MSIRIRLAFVAVLGSVLAVTGCQSATNEGMGTRQAGALTEGSGATVAVAGQYFAMIDTADSGDKPIQLSSPRGMALTHDGRQVYIADSGNNRIVRVALTPAATSAQAKKRSNSSVSNPAASVETIAGTGTPCRRYLTGNDYCGDDGPAVLATLNKPADVALTDDESFLYVSDTGTNLIRKIDLSSGVITTVAGTGEMGYTGDGSGATDATLAAPQGVLPGPGGELYFSDTSNNAIRRIDATGVIETVAGNGSACADPWNGCGDGGPAMQARLSAPIGLAWAKAPSTTAGLLIADSESHKIRVLNSDGTIATVLGDGRPGGNDEAQKGTGIRLSRPVDVAVTGRHGFLVANAGNSTIRSMWKFSGKTAELVPQAAYTLAGNGKPGFSGDGGPAWQAVLSEPAGIAVNGSNILISDSGNDRLRIASEPKGSTDFRLPKEAVCRGQSNLSVANAVAVIPVIAGVQGVNVEAFGAAGGRTIAPTQVIYRHGGAGGYAQSGGPLVDDAFVAFLGCRGGNSASYSSTSGGGGGGASAVLTSVGYDSSDRDGIVVVGGGGSGSGFLSGRGVVAGSPGANGGGQLGGGQYPGGQGKGGLDGDAPRAPATLSGRDGFGGSGGNGDYPANGGEGFQWSADDGTGGSGLTGGGGGWGGGAGLGTQGPEHTSAASGGGSYSACGDTSAGTLQGDEEHGVVVITIRERVVGCKKPVNRSPR